MQASSAVLLGDKVPLAWVRVFRYSRSLLRIKIDFKLQNGLGALNKVGKMVPWYNVNSCWRVCLLNIRNTIWHVLILFWLAWNTQTASNICAPPMLRSVTYWLPELGIQIFILVFAARFWTLVFLYIGSELEVLFLHIFWKQNMSMIKIW